MPSKRRESRLFPTRTGGWQVWIGNASGTHVRKGDLLESVGTHEEPVRGIKTFSFYYRENERCKERTYGFVPRMSLQKNLSPEKVVKGRSKKDEPEAPRSAPALSFEGARVLPGRGGSCRKESAI